MPDFNYRVTIDALNLEILAIDQNYKDLGGIGGDSSGHVQVDATCGGDSALASRLGDIGASGEALLAAAAAEGAADATQTRNVLILQHYNGACSDLVSSFEAAAPDDEALDVRCSFGHVHDSQCEMASLASSGGYSAHTAVNCYEDHGATDLESPAGSSAGAMSVIACEALCDATDGCDAVVVSAGGCEAETDYDYYGNDLSSVSASGSEECCAACARVDGCAAWTYASGACYLKTSTAGRVYKKGAVSAAFDASADGECYRRAGVSRAECSTDGF